MDNHNPRAAFSSKQANAGLFERSKRIKTAAEMGLVLSSPGRHWSRAVRRRLIRGKGTIGRRRTNEAALASSEVVEENEEDDGAAAEEIETRVRALQKLVPGGEELGVERLFEEAADYIEALQGQVSAMRELMCLLDRLEMEKKRRGR